MKNQQIDWEELEKNLTCDGLWARRTVVARSSGKDWHHLTCFEWDCGWICGGCRRRTTRWARGAGDGWEEPTSLWTSVALGAVRVAEEFRMWFFQNHIFVFSFRIWNSTEWWDFIFKIKLLETLQRNAFGCLVLPPPRMWSRRWRRNSGRTCGCCHPPSTPSMKCTSVEVCAHT